MLKNIIATLLMRPPSVDRLVIDSLEAHRRQLLAAEEHRDHYAKQCEFHEMRIAALQEQAQHPVHGGRSRAV